jgi:hypothetical protein
MNLMPTAAGRGRWCKMGRLSGLLFSSILIVSGCGGGNGGGDASAPPPVSYAIGGTVSGLNSGTQIVLLNNGGDTKTVTVSGAFSFATPLASGASFAVTVGTAPAGEACSVSNGSGTVGTANVTNVAIVCNTLFTIGGVVTGLDSGSQVVLLNNGGNGLTVTANGTFSFTTSLASTSAYVVTVGTAPTGETCTVSNGSGNVGAADVTNVMLACAASISDSNLLLELGHTHNVAQMQMTSSRALSEDSSGHWVLWNAATDSMIANGNASCLTSSCTASSLVVPVALSNQTLVIETASALEICAASDGHVVATIPGPLSWWKLASDGSYITTGSPTTLQAWSSSGQRMYSFSGDYSKADAYAAPGQIQVALGPAGDRVIQTIVLAGGTSSVGPQFNGQFNEWFVDGSRFQTLVGSTVYTYLNTSVQQDLTSLPPGQGLGGQGTWFWSFGSSGLNVYEVGSSAAPAATYTTGTAPIVSGATLGLLGPTQVTIVDLSGPTPTSSVRTVPVTPTAYAAISPTEWLIGDNYGVVFDGTSSTAAPKYLALGAAKSIAGGGGVAAIATASGQIFVINPQTGVVQNTIAFFGSQLQMSADGTVLAAMTDTSATIVFTIPVLQIYSLPAGTVVQTLGNSGSSYLYGYSLAGSGNLIAQVTGPLLGGVEPQGANLQQVTDITGSTVIWSSGTELIPVLFSPDGTLIAASNASAPIPTAAANIYQNGTLVGAVSGAPVGWIDNNRLLVDSYAANEACDCFLYSASTIYSPSGSVLSSPALPAFTSLQTATPNTVYSNEYNVIYSLTMGASTWTGTPPANAPNSLGAIAGAYAVVVSGTQVRAEPY